MDEFAFTEREDYEKGFADIYERQLAPYLQELEVRRKRAVKRSWRIIGLIAVVSIFLAWQAASLDPIVPVFPILIGGFASLYFYISRGDKLKGELTEFIRPVLCDFLKDVSYAEESSAEEIRLEQLIRLCLIPKAKDHDLGPRLSGEWRGVSYQLVKSRFYNEYRDSDDKVRTNTLFSGILIEVDCWNPMPTTVFLPDLGTIGNQLHEWASRNMRPAHKLEFSEEDIEDAFEIYSEDPVRSMQELGAPFARKLVSLSREYQGATTHVSAAFEGKKFFVAIRLSHDFLNFDVMSRPLNEVDEKIHQALADLTLPRRVIDQLLD